MSMNIENAFCREMNEIIDIYQARDYFESNGKRRLAFICSFGECKARRVKVTGVNYDKSYLETKTFLKPHFRENSKYTHHEDCIWKVATEETFSINNDSSTEVITGKRRKKLSSNVDIFSPKFSNSKAIEGRISVQIVQRLNLITDRNERRRVLKDILRNSPSKSSLLENVVNCYLDLNEKKRKDASLSIEGFSKDSSYENIFKHIQYYELGEPENHIYYGGASVKKYGENYGLYFYDLEPKTGKRITLYIEKPILDAYKKSTYLMEILESSAISTDFYTTCYFFGILEESEANSKYIDIKLDHLDNLVLKLREKKRK